MHTRYDIVLFAMVTRSKIHVKDTFMEMFQKFNTNLLPTNKRAQLDRCDHDYNGTSRFNQLGNGSSPTSCAICLEDYQADDDVAYSKDLKCKHAFHKTCITKWLQSHHNCPVCRIQFYEKKIKHKQQDSTSPRISSRVSRRSSFIL